MTKVRVNLRITAQLFVKWDRTLGLAIRVLGNPNLVQIVTVAIQYLSLRVLASVVDYHEVITDLDLLPENSWIEDSLACHSALCR